MVRYCAMCGKVHEDTTDGCIAAAAPERTPPTSKDLEPLRPLDLIRAASGLRESASALGDVRVRSGCYRRVAAYLERLAKGQPDAS